MNVSSPSAPAPLRRPGSRSPSPAVLAAICLACGMTHAIAQAEAVTVTRKTGDLYGVKGDNVLLMTAGCEVHALNSPARLQPDGSRMVLRFDAGASAGSSAQQDPNPGEMPGARTCELRDMLMPQPVPGGRYQVSLSFDSADWYAIAGTSLLLRTVGCQRRSASEPVVWFQPLEGKGVIEYRSGASCSSDGVFGSVRLQARTKAVTQGR